MTVNHWSEILGNDVDAETVADMAEDAGLSLEDFIAAMVHELAEENPDAGWDQLTPKDASDMAEDIRYDLGRS